ncbi:hypothetical protein DUNSADRAFT_10569 [Dunaliella salina]|uniref:B30.2/SPRY domain-containing protein n=1 Tax=Dunaliella salina TaxID=3046 RepID=A0ABQ7H4V5_DUNSA|nr:hypothetical protein DUNSADRAFT_10569 [Dunaliella salina]|eukprot:KAF5841863.1 hypothetical protein DUNSADRAFT_10569 [Dunaliella salina]
MPALFEPAHEASLLRKATSSSWSTDHNLLIHVLAENERTNDQMQELRRAFLKEYKTCPIETVRKATNLPHQAAYNWALLATLLTPDEFAAQCLHLSMAGLGTDERAMTQILAHSTKDEVERIKKTYLRMYSKTLESDIEDDTSGDEREFFLGLINAPRSHVDVAAAQDEIDQDVKELYIAGQRKWSTDVSAFAKIITKHDNEYLAALNMAYGRAYGDTLQRAVEKQISQSVLANGIAAMIMDRADYYASELYWAIQGAGTNTDTLTRIIATQRHAMPAICHRYMTKYGKNLKQHLDQETAVKGTQYGKVLQSLLKVAEATGHKLPTGSGTPQASVEPGPEPNPVPIPQPNPVPIPQPIPQPSPEPKPETKPEPQQPVKLNSSEPGSVVSPMSHMRLGGANPGKSCEAEPTCLNTTATGHGVEIGDDKLSVRYLADGRNSNDVGSVMANEPVPGDRSTFYYEMQVVDPGVLGCIAIGFADAGFKLTRQPGWEPNSYGYHGDDGRKFSSGKFEKYGPTFGAGDIIGAGIHLSQKEIFFTKNGVNLGRAFQNAHGVLYPVIGMHSKNESVRVNFQGPFRFDIDKVRKVTHFFDKLFIYGFA